MQGEGKGFLGENLISCDTISDKRAGGSKFISINFKPSKGMKKISMGKNIIILNSN